MYSDLLTQLDEGVERSDASQHAGQLVAADVSEPFVQSVLHQSVEAQQTAGAGRERERRAGGQRTSGARPEPAGGPADTQRTQTEQCSLETSLRYTVVQYSAVLDSFFRDDSTLTHMTIQVTQLRLNSNPKFANLTQLRLNSKPNFNNLTQLI